MFELLTPVLIVFAIVAIGYVACLGQVVSIETGDHLARFAFSIAVPVLLFRTMALSDLGDVLPWRLWISYYFAILIIWSVGHVLMRMLFKTDVRTGVISGLSSSFSNTAFLGIPLVGSIYGEAGFAILSLIISIHLLVMMVAVVVLHDWACTKDGVNTPKENALNAVKRFFKDLFSNPILIGALMGLIWRFGDIPFPKLLDTITGQLAMVAGPVALFSMGTSLKKFGFTGRIPKASLTSFLKLVAMPTLVLGLGFALDLSPLALHVAVILAAIPTGANPYLIATHFGTGQGVAANAMTLSTVLGAISIPVWLWILQSYFAM